MDASSPIPGLPPGVFGRENRMLNASTVEGLVLTTLSLAMVILFIRIYVRAFMLKHWGWDDTFMSTAMFASLATSVGILAQSEWANSLGILYGSTRAFQAGLTVTISYAFANSFVKLSIMFFCITTFGRLGKKVRWALIGIAIFIAVHLLIAIIVVAVGCRNFASNMDDFVERQRCAESPAGSVANAIFYVIEDAIVLLAPIYLVSQVQANPRSKRFLLGILCLGGFAFIAGVARLVSLLAFLMNYQNQITEAVLAIMTACEVNIAIVAASLPSLTPLLKAVIRHFFEVKDTTIERLKSVTPAPTPPKRRTLDLPSLTRRSSMASAKSEALPLHGIKIDQTFSIETSMNPYMSGVPGSSAQTLQSESRKSLVLEEHERPLTPPTVPRRPSIPTMSPRLPRYM